MKQKTAVTDVGGGTSTPLMPKIKNKKNSK
jgi:hypothetical protein